LKPVDGSDRSYGLAGGWEALDSAWKALVADGQWDALVACLLQEHYDPVYLRSIQTNYRQAGQAQRVVLDSADRADFERAARELAQSAV